MELGRKKVRLGELLVNSGVITAEQLQQALDNPNRQGKKLGEFLVDEGIVSEDDLAKALSRQLDLDMIDLQSVNVDKEVLNLVPVNVLKKNKIFPFAYKENNFNVLMVAMADPLDYNAIDDINIITNFQVEPVVATTRSIMLAIDKYFGQEEVTEALAAYAKEKKLDVVEDIATEENINSSPIVMLVKDMIEKAVRQRTVCQHRSHQDHRRHGYLREEKTSGRTYHPDRRPCGIRYPCVRPAYCIWGKSRNASCCEERTEP